MVLDRLRSADIEMEDVTLRLGGLAQHLDDPATRNVTVNVEGLATGVWAADPEVARALGTRIDLFADATLPPGGAGDASTSSSSAATASRSSPPASSRTWSTPAATRCGSPTSRSSPASPTGRSAARSTCAPTAASPRSAAASISPSTAAPPTSCLGDAAARPAPRRRDPGLRPRGPRRGRRPHREPQDRQPAAQLRLRRPDSPARRPTSASTPASPISTSSIPASAAPLTATGRASGNGQPIAVSVAAPIPQGELMGRKLTNARVGFDGQVNGADVTGSLSGSGGLDGLVLSLAGDVASVGAQPLDLRPRSDGRPEPAERRADQGRQPPRSTAA